MGVLEKAIDAWGIFGALDALTGVWGYKLFLLGYYLVAFLFLRWFGRTSLGRGAGAGRVLLFATTIAAVCTPAVAAIGAAVLVPFPLLLVAEVFLPGPSGTSLFAGNWSLLLAGWGTALVLVALVRYSRHGRHRRSA